MKLSTKLNSELNNEFDEMAYILKRHTQGNKKRRAEIKMQSRANKIVSTL